jgi:membrane-associated protease RseP (regulator of RpoE activity)
VNVPEQSLVPVEAIVSKILFLRGEKVILDRDLAELYGVETRVLNQAVRRNARRFPKDFMFTLTREEVTRISQTVTSSKVKYSKRVTAFTEQGVAMLSSVLNSDRAIEVNVAIMRAFVQLRRMIGSHEELARKLAELEARFSEHDEQIQAIFEAIRQLMAPPDRPPRKIGFEVGEKSPTYRTRGDGSS